MDLNTICDAIFDFIDRNALADLDWPDIEAAVADARSKHLVTLSALPVLMSVATGGPVDEAIPLGASWVLYNLASDLFDDLQDQDGKDRPWNIWSVSRATNVGLGLIAAAQRCLAYLPNHAMADIIKTWSFTFANAAKGQHIEQPIVDTIDYFDYLIAKSGLIFAVVAQAGVRLSTDDEAALRAAHTFGLNLGLLIQIIDDCGDLFPSRTDSDLSNKTFTLPIIHALSQTEHPNHRHLQAILNAVAPLTEAQIKAACAMLEAMGAVSYSLAVAKAHEQIALDALSTFQESPAIDHLKHYVCQLDPIRRLQSRA